ncbi:hypothetical protein NDN08_002068 [Rhodosorus marinus]|uniref:CCHC-type domain-containing protein n=1 Tax=Rhodosorus marinus TaxID=101924 RepID=A0AAV8UYH0_9RHOD|nr:hypothetical protein NDN08_002068 [Rhodosorus marinus]
MPEDDSAWEIIQPRLKEEAAIDIDPDSNAERTPTLLHMRVRESERACHKCGRGGHLPRDCKTCFGCGNVGNFKRNCHQLKQQRSKRGRQWSGHNGPKKFNASGSREKYTLLAIGGSSDKNDLLVDSGASEHIFGNREFFDNLGPVTESKVVLADREISCTHEGTVLFQVKTDVGVPKLGLLRVKYSSASQRL